MPQPRQRPRPGPPPPKQVQELQAARREQAELKTTTTATLSQHSRTLQELQGDVRALRAAREGQMALAPYDGDADELHRTPEPKERGDLGESPGYQRYTFT
jgi:hypothetical protein